MNDIWDKTDIDFFTSTSSDYNVNIWCNITPILSKESEPDASDHPLIKILEFVLIIFMQIIDKIEHVIVNRRERRK